MTPSLSNNTAAPCRSDGHFPRLHHSPTHPRHCLNVVCRVPVLLRVLFLTTAWRVVRNIRQQKVRILSNWLPVHQLVLFFQLSDFSVGQLAGRTHHVFQSTERRSTLLYVQRWPQLCAVNCILLQFSLALCRWVGACKLQLSSWFQFGAWSPNMTIV